MNNSELPKYFKFDKDEIWFEEFEVEKKTMKITYKLNKILSYCTSKYQEIALIDTNAFGPCLVLDGIMQSTTKDGFIYNEMITHIPMLTHKKPKRALVIGGGDCGRLENFPSIENWIL
jgi:Spermidine synthase